MKEACMFDSEDAEVVYSNSHFFGDNSQRKNIESALLLTIIIKDGVMHVRNKKGC
jgi:hypothetical protein